MKPKVGIEELCRRAQLRLDRRVPPPTFTIASPGQARAMRWRRREGRQEFMAEGTSCQARPMET